MEQAHAPAYRLIRRPAPTAPALRLDQAQQAVVDHAGGPLLVLAGPGTGKTTTIVAAVADRIEQRGIDPEVARDMVHEVMADPQLALETHAREELGISPDHLGSPLQAALSSFLTFALGAFIPLLPWLITKGNGAIVASVVLSAMAAVAVGVVLAAFTQRSLVRSALRQLVITAVAAAVTYGVGRGIGTGLG